MIRLLTRADEATIWALLQASSDYIRLERDEEPRPCLVDEYLTDAPPGVDPQTSYRAGLFDGDSLLALAEMSFGYPAAGDCYLGLMLLRGTARGQGLGVRMLRHLEGVARGRGARQMFLAVLDANPRGRAFWQREGFRDTGFAGEVTLGRKTQAAQRFVKPL